MFCPFLSARDRACPPMLFQALRRAKIHMVFDEFLLQNSLGFVGLLGDFSLPPLIITRKDVSSTLLLPPSYFSFW